MSGPVLTSRALGMLGLVDGVCESVQLLAAYAARNPGMDPENYGGGMDGWRAYRAEARRVSRDLDDAREACRLAAALGVTDEEVAEATRGDRLTIERRADGSWFVDYTTGQYWPTEYRPAVARVLRRAINSARDRLYGEKR